MRSFRRFFPRGKYDFGGIKKRLFHSFGIKDVLLKRLKNVSIEKPTAIQEKVSILRAVSECKILHVNKNFILNVFSLNIRLTNWEN